MAESFNLSKPNRKVHAGVILLNSVTEILDVAPFHLMGTMGHHLREIPDSVYSQDLKTQALDIECHWVNETGEPAQMTAGMRVIPTDTFATCPPLDIVLIGANKMDYEPSDAEIAFLRKSYKECHAFIAVCGGFRPLLLAGLLEDKKATAPLGMLDQLRQTWPNTSWVAKRWYRDGKLWTTGQLLNGLDAMRAFAEQTWGGQGGLVEKVLNNGSWPVRDVDYKENHR